MTEEYGLAASLAITEEAFRKFKNRQTPQGTGVVSRIVYLDAGGERCLTCKR